MTDNVMSLLFMVLYVFAGHVLFILTNVFV